ncbi:MAG TPA: hypothetical protein VJP77_04670 [Planctomycetota bacterium]|nr:hypothetical protein [Planctomycetota bacterium]
MDEITTRLTPEFLGERPWPRDRIRMAASANWAVWETALRAHPGRAHCDRIEAVFDACDMIGDAIFDLALATQAVGVLNGLPRLGPHGDDWRKQSASRGARQAVKSAAHACSTFLETLHKIEAVAPSLRCFDFNQEIDRCLLHFIKCLRNALEHERPRTPGFRAVYEMGEEGSADQDAKVYKSGFLLDQSWLGSERKPPEAALKYLENQGGNVDPVRMFTSFLDHATEFVRKRTTAALDELGADLADYVRCRRIGHAEHYYSLLTSAAETGAIPIARVIERFASARMRLEALGFSDPRQRYDYLLQALEPGRFPDADRRIEFLQRLVANGD